MALSGTRCDEPMISVDDSAARWISPDECGRSSAVKVPDVRVLSLGEPTTIPLARRSNDIGPLGLRRVPLSIVPLLRCSITGGRNPWGCSRIDRSVRLPLFSTLPLDGLWS